MKTEEKLNSLFETLRAEKASTSVSEISAWIGVASAATAVGTSLPFLLKLKGLLISKLGIMTLTTLATFSVVGVMYFSGTTEVKEAPIQPREKSIVTTVDSVEKEEIKAEIQPAIFPIVEEEKSTSIFPEIVSFFERNEEDFPIMEPRKSTRITPAPKAAEGSFTKINARGGFEIEVVKGATSSYEVLGDEDDANSVKVSISNNTIYLTPGKSSGKNGSRTVRLTMSELNGIDLGGACVVKSDDTFPGSNLELKTSGASTIKLGITVSKLTAVISGASDIDLFGNATEVSLTCSGASELDWEKLTITTAEVNCSGASEIVMNVTNSLSGTLSGASDFEYISKPAEFNLKSSGASDIHQR